ncbi:hypothetical protein B0H63DRAFT_554216 [Podospora didyma]|uniref:Uncharacterized protein n=1 Tax=Podospora didyma TaxID=330526 RepID=A0AAE0P3K7_9PEZI|nr:hypothetical protein B0H63DRAFT_554216 [Podospora didyma]
MMVERTFGENNTLEMASLQVNSLHMLAIPKDKVGYYPAMQADCDAPSAWTLLRLEKTAYDKTKWCGKFLELHCTYTDYDGQRPGQAAKRTTRKECRSEAAGVAMEYSALVAVFLKPLKYYSGIVFLTSNRAVVDDRAIKSRISLA